MIPTSPAASYRDDGLVMTSMLSIDFPEHAQRFRSRDVGPTASRQLIS